MRQDYEDKKPSSFAETVQLVENHVRVEIARETKAKQLYYHTLEHALAVRRRANQIFQAVKPVLSQSYAESELARLEKLIELCGLAHDMVQIFVPNVEPNKPRKRQVGLSENKTARKLLDYIQQLNQKLAIAGVDSTILFSDRDRQIIQEAILATICQLDPQANRAGYKFSSHSIYQPYLYDSEPKASIVGSIIALADLGAFGIEGVDSHIRDGILVFAEDNLDLRELVLNCDLPKYRQSNSLTDTDLARIRARLLAMTKFMADLARDRLARFELEITEFPLPARQILRDLVFVYFDRENMRKIEQRIPTAEDTKLSQLIDFFCVNKICS